MSYLISFSFFNRDRSLLQILANHKILFYTLALFFHYSVYTTAHAASEDFITTWKTDIRPDIEDIDKIFINTVPGTEAELQYNFDIQWGDGHFDTNVTGNTSHTYAVPGIYTVIISGKFPIIRFQNQEKLISVEQWGDTQLRNLRSAFSRCKNIRINATDSPNLSNVSNMSNMFFLASSFNDDISSWDLSNITNLNNIFFGASSFNQPLGTWDVSNVTNMSSMFANASNFNQPLNTWNVSSVTNMNNLFHNASSYNQPLNLWNVSNATKMRFMFSGARNFNQSLNSWDVSSVTNMEDMFSWARNFNQPLNSWDVSSVTNMRNMFRITEAFNMPLNLWNTSNVTNMSGIFANARAFNQPLDSWNISNVTDLSSLFSSITAFSRENYDQTLIGWSMLTTLQSEVQLDVNVEYSSGEAAAAREHLTSTFNWNINDKGEHVPLEVTNFEACDGCSSEHIELTWDRTQAAIRYLIYRSQFIGDRGLHITTVGSDSISYFDTSAVPGVTYYYTLIPIGSNQAEGTSEKDTGVRIQLISPEQDTDGDSVSDLQENVDGTDRNDPGSFMLHLKSPAYTKYNTFLDQFNFLELTATGENPVEVTISIYDIHGNLIILPEEKSNIIIPPLQQRDIDIHSLVAKNTYGVVKINFNEGNGTTLRGRMSNYKLNSDSTTYSFAFAKELRNPSRGISYATANSHDPQGMGFIVPNWLEIMNLDPVTREFTYNIYSINGELVETTVVTIPPIGEIDFQAGHVFGQGVYLVEIIPSDGATEYFSTVTRYSSNEISFTGNSFNFAIPVDAKAGTGTSLYAPITNRSENCWRQTNWIEIVNTREIPVSATVDIYGRSGSLLNSLTVELQSKQQQHINASGLLAAADETAGSVKVEGIEPGSIISQSLVYYHDCTTNLTQTAYASSARIPARDAQLGTFNSFIGIKNQLTVIGTTSSVISANLEASYYLPDNSLVENQYNAQLLPLGSETLPINSSNIFSLPENRNGVVTVRSPAARQIIVENLRVRTVNGKVDFAMPTVVQ